LQPLLDPLASLLGLAPAALRTGLRHWAAAAALLVTGLALRGTWEDPARPYAPALATLAASALLGAVALGFRLPRYVYSSGLLINVAAGMAWVGWGEASAAGFVLAQVLAFAGASALWSVIELARRARGLAGPWGEGWSFSRAAAGVALLLHAGVTVA